MAFFLFVFQIPFVKQMITYRTIYIYKEECLSVCPFAMHSVPVIASVTKLSTELPYVQRKAERGLARPMRMDAGVWVRFHPFSPCNS
jgi:hypothetical protein